MVHKNIHVKIMNRIYKNGYQSSEMCAYAGGYLQAILDLGFITWDEYENYLNKKFNLVRVMQ